jgi:hypothetical protein
MVEYEKMWNNIEQRLLMVPGKEIIGSLNTYLQEKYGINISTRLIVDSFLRGEVPEEMINLISLIDKFANHKI